MKQRYVLTGLIGAARDPFVRSFAARDDGAEGAMIGRIEKSDAEWKALLSPAQFDVLRREGTEAPWTSPLNDEKRKGPYVCVACDLALFTSDMKYDSGTGWPNFHSTLPGVFKDRKFNAIFQEYPGPLNRGQSRN